MIIKDTKTSTASLIAEFRFKAFSWLNKKANEKLDNGWKIVVESMLGEELRDPGIVVKEITKDNGKEKNS